ncbi:MAG: hypothetical protein FE78DRAFT_70997 [Acidomyces sp. 'richmondensis']|nr:MAG: hypothetical protein FE78DRAFT_70997 [Acidomyces sp. 'richmondensis']
MADLTWTREKKRYQKRAVPKGYVDFLEDQHTYLVVALREMYHRMNGAVRCFAPSVTEWNREKSVHDILSSLGIIENLPEDTKLVRQMSCTNCGHSAALQDFIEDQQRSIRRPSVCTTSPGTDCPAIDNSDSPSPNTIYDSTTESDIQAPVIPMSIPMTASSTSLAFGLDTPAWSATNHGEHAFGSYFLTDDASAGEPHAFQLDIYGNHVQPQVMAPTWTLNNYSSQVVEENELDTRYFPYDWGRPSY